MDIVSPTQEPTPSQKLAWELGRIGQWNPIFHWLGQNNFTHRSSVSHPPSLFYSFLKEQHKRPLFQTLPSQTDCSFSSPQGFIGIKHSQVMLGLLSEIGTFEKGRVSSSAFSYVVRHIKVFLEESRFSEWKGGQNLEPILRGSLQHQPHQFQFHYVGKHHDAGGRKKIQQNYYP